MSGEGLDEGDRVSTGPDAGGRRRGPHLRLAAEAPPTSREEGLREDVGVGRPVWVPGRVGPSPRVPSAAHTPPRPGVRHPGTECLVRTPGPAPKNRPLEFRWHPLVFSTKVRYRHRWTPSVLLPGFYRLWALAEWDTGIMGCTVSSETCTLMLIPGTLSLYWTHRPTGSGESVQVFQSLFVFFSPTPRLRPPPRSSCPHVTGDLRPHWGRLSVRPLPWGQDVGVLDLRLSLAFSSLCLGGGPRSRTTVETLWADSTPRRLDTLT